MVRLLNNRLSTIFVDNSILNKTQFAGLPGSSTFEPLRIVNEIIQDAKESNNELWILFQDLSKAYDRVNINMLTKAMERLKLPSSFIKLIANLDRKSTRLNSSHSQISYAVFCLKKKKQDKPTIGVYDINCTSSSHHRAVLLTD